VRQLRENVEQYTGPSTAHVTFGPRPRRPDRGAGADAGREAEAGRGWPGLLRGRWRRDDRESLVCYALYAGVFVADMSLLALAFPAALYLYALLVNPPARQFWQVWRPRASPWFRYQARWCLLVIIFPANLI